MKRKIRFLMPYLVLLFFLFLFPKNVHAADTVTVTVSATADNTEIQDALNIAKVKNYEDKLIVKVPAGTHILRKKLFIYSNTTLQLATGATIRAEFVASENDSNGLSGPMIYAGHVNDEGKQCTGVKCTHGGYTRFHDITIEGGTWDRGSVSNVVTGIISLRYGRNVILRDMEVKNATEHFINVSATRNTKIENVVFSDQVIHSDKSDKSFWGSKTNAAERYSFCEALHIDFLYDRNEGGEDTNYYVPCRDILVQNCTFRNVWSGIGTHHKQIERSSQITIRNNVFQNVRGRCVGAFGYMNLSITGNVCTVTGPKSVSSFLYCYASDGVVSGNQVNGAYEFVHGVGKNALTIRNNVINNSVSNGMYFYDDDGGMTITNNQILNSGNSGIYLGGNTKAQISNNQILTSKGGNGISVNQSSYACITDNTIKNVKRHGIYMNTSKSYGIVLRNYLDNIGISGIIIDRCGKYYQVNENTINNSVYYDVYVKNTSRCTTNDNNCYFNKGNLRYKITQNGKYVMLLGPVNKNVSSITIPSSIKKGYYTYKVKSINKNAFKDCKKTKKFVIRTTVLSSVGKNAFKSVNSKAKILVPKKYLKKYTKLLKKKGQGKKVIIKSI